MRYFLRALKYFIYICILGALIVVLFTLLQGGSFDIDTLFIQGKKSIYMILGLFAVISAIYPAIGYQKRSMSFSGNWDEIKPEIISIMKERRFKVENDGGSHLTFISDGGAARFLRMYEDRITIDAAGGVMLLEGHRRNLIRVMFDIESYLQKNQGNS
ncbi:MAG: hypothetical protein IAB81_06395 [Bacteroidetes bacterium]|uniref:Uncharacterized protein n=1 Tax=Candidatus Merdivivens pullicola TaxID=2840872 RepID=A0A9D9IKM0_9BACT|nr:hypothetical protein [Candidatus Merdivivens pullicola]